MGKQRRRLFVVFVVCFGRKKVEWKDLIVSQFRRWNVPNFSFLLLADNRQTYFGLWRCRPNSSAPTKFNFWQTLALELKRTQHLQNTYILCRRISSLVDLGGSRWIHMNSRAGFPRLWLTGIVMDSREIAAAELNFNCLHTIGLSLLLFSLPIDDRD